MEEIIKEGSTALEFKRKISPHINESVEDEIPLSRFILENYFIHFIITLYLDLFIDSVFTVYDYRIRLRRKGSTCPGKVFLDNHVFDSVLSGLTSNTLELYITILQGILKSAILGVYR